MKTFAYIQNLRIPQEMAHSIAVVKATEAAGELVGKAYLVHPKRRQTPELENTNTFDFYNLKRTFSEVEFSVPELLDLPAYAEKLYFKFRYQVTAWMFSFKAIYWASKNKIDIIETSSPEVLFALKLFSPIYRPKVIYDLHLIHTYWLNRVLEFMSQNIVDLWLLSNSKISRRLDELSVPKDKALVLPNGYDPTHYNPKHKKVLKNTFVIGYIGRFETMGVEKGVFTLLRLVSKLKKTIPVKLIIVGGPDEFLKKYKELVDSLDISERVEMKSQVPQRQVGKLLESIHLASLLYPDHPHFRKTMSPMKAIEYLASGTPVIASDFPSCREILKDYAVYSDPEDLTQLNRLILKIYKNYSHYVEVANQGKIYVQQYTWKNKMKIVLERVTCV